MPCSNSAAPSRHIPLEIWEEVIDSISTVHGATRIRSLAASCRVCRDWLPRARFHLYRVIVLRSSADLVQVTKNLTLFPGLRLLVQMLTIDGTTSDRSWITLVPMHLAPMVRHLPILIFYKVDLTAQHPRFHPSYSLFPNIALLRLESIRYTQVGQVARLIRATRCTQCDILEDDTVNSPTSSFSSLFSTPPHRIRLHHKAVPAWSKSSASFWPASTTPDTERIATQIDAAWSPANCVVSGSQDIWTYLVQMHNAVHAQHPGHGLYSPIVFLTSIAVYDTYVVSLFKSDSIPSSPCTGSLNKHHLVLHAESLDDPCISILMHLLSAILSTSIDLQMIEINSIHDFPGQPSIPPTTATLASWAALPAAPVTVDVLSRWKPIDELLWRSSVTSSLLLSVNLPFSDLPRGPYKCQRDLFGELLPTSTVGGKLTEQCHVDGHPRCLYCHVSEFKAMERHEVDIDIGVA